MNKTFIKIDDSGFNMGRNFEIRSFSWGPNSLGSGHTISRGSNTDPGRPQPNVRDFSVTCSLDRNSVWLQKAAIDGKTFDMTVLFSKPLNRGWTPYMQFKMTNAMVSNFSTGGGTTGPSCFVSFSCTDIKFN
jgi:type VI secretion system secreted protein Hcp